MDKEKIRKELYEKVNEWFTEQPQRPIAQFMIETMWQYIEAAQHHMHSDAATPSEDGRCPACGEYIKHVCLAE